MKIRNIKKHQSEIPSVAQWFHSKWGVPVEAYVESMNDSIKTEEGVPMWYYIVDEHENIIAGLGVIENDFHKRPDLTPNICAVYVEESHRKLGLAKAMLKNACLDLHKYGIDDVYLITTHTDLYERCGWEFFDIIEDNEGAMVRMYHKCTKSN